MHVIQRWRKLSAGAVLFPISFSCEFRRERVRRNGIAVFHSLSKDISVDRFMTFLHLCSYSSCSRTRSQCHLAYFRCQGLVVRRNGTMWKKYGTLLAPRKEEKKGGEIWEIRSIVTLVHYGNNWRQTSWFILNRGLYFYLWFHEDSYLVPLCF